MGIIAGGRKKHMKKRTIICGLMMGMILSFTGSVFLDSVPGLNSTVYAAEKKSKDQKTKDSTKKNEAGTSVSIKSEEDINKFLKGEWRLCDSLSDEEFGTLTLDGVGGASFKLDCEDDPVEGEFYVYKHEMYDSEKDDYVQDDEYTGFTVGFTDIPDEYIMPLSSNWKPMDKEISGGDFFIARGNGYDYLSLKWFGNGDSFIFENIFQNKERISEEYDETDTAELQDRWIFTRKSEGLSKMKKEKKAEFYAFLWQTEEDNRYFLQTMEPVTYETEDEYTGRRYKGGYFIETDDIGIVEYNMSEKCDDSMVLDHLRLYNKYPAKMYLVKTDKNGDISAIEDVNEAYYGDYDFGNLKQEYDFDDTSFTINGFTTELKDLETIANAVIDMFEIGDYIVAECHINPHMSAYFITDIYTNSIVKEIYGANLTWIDDDITTAVYSVWEGLYNFEGDLIDYVDGDEIYEVKMKKSGKEIEVRDSDDKAYTFKNELIDRAMYRYVEYLYQPTAEKWNAFMKFAPKNAVAFVIENPPEDILNILPYVEPNSEDYPEYVFVIALDDGTTIRFDQGEIDFDTDDLEFISKKTLIEYERNNSQAAGYSMVIPEGPPSVCVYVSTWDKGGSLPIATLSGETTQYSTFITSTMTPEEVEKTRPVTKGKSGKGR